jgi:hypothetical protein
LICEYSCLRSEVQLLNSYVLTLLIVDRPR